MGGVSGVDARRAGWYFNSAGGENAGTGESRFQRFAEPKLDGRGRLREFCVGLGVGAH